MRVLGPLLLTLYVVRRVRNSQTASTAAPCGPFRRGQRCGPWTAGTTLRVDPWPPTARTRVAHRSTAPGGTPPGTPRRASARPTFLKISPECGNPPAFGLRAALAPPRWSAGSRGPWPGGHRGRSPGGPGGGTPRRRGAALGGGRDAASEARSPPEDGRRGAGRPPPGGYLCPKGRTTLRSNV